MAITEAGMAAGEPAMLAAVPEDCGLGRIYDAAAHDLRASLRHIRLLLEWMFEDHRAELSEAAVEKLDGLRGCANRLDALVGGLVELMRLEAAAEPVQAIDAATRVAGALADAAPPPGFTVRVAGALPAFHGAPGLVRRIVARHGGQVRIEQPAGDRGCCLVLTLPDQRACAGSGSI